MILIITHLYHRLYHCYTHPPLSTIYHKNDWYYLRKNWWAKFLALNLVLQPWWWQQLQPKTSPSPSHALLILLYRLLSPLCYDHSVMIILIHSNLSELILSIIGLMLPLYISLFWSNLIRIVFIYLFFSVSLQYDLVSPLSS